MGGGARPRTSADRDTFTRTASTTCPRCACCECDRQHRR
jgi:hypothetical protein